MNVVTEHHLETDVLVAGGGMAGICCALAAARAGVRTVLCQDRPVLGGNASSEVRMHIVGAAGTGSFERSEPLITEPREGGILEEIRLETAVRNPQRSASMFDLILFEKCRAEPNLTLLLNTTVVGVEMQKPRIASVIADRSSTEDRFIISASIFVDCTGDGRLAAEAGAQYLEGRESRNAFGESLAPPAADRGRLGSTILLMARRHDQPVPFVAPAWSRRFTREQLQYRLHSPAGEEKPSLEYGYWWAEYGGQRDTIKDNEAIRDELLAIAMGIWDYIKNGPTGDRWHDDPFDAANWALDWFGFVPGKRESRRFLGQYVLTQNDILDSVEFDDAIAYGGWAIDLHPPEGIDIPDEPPCRQTPVPYMYDIPLRACIARNVPNLMFAGRNISATHIAFASTRVMGTCAVVGQGVGTAAAWAVKQKLAPAELPHRADAMHAIQQMLLRADAYLIGRRNDDPNDLARTARVTATSWTVGGEPQLITSGLTRSVHGSRGAPPDRTSPGTHRWMSDPNDGLPVSILLEWQRPIQARRVILVFDTGMHRHLTLSHHDGYTARMQWGRAQKETVRDYVIEARTGDHWTRWCAVAGNYQRRRVHDLGQLQSVDALRVTVTATNGLDHARICEIRVE